MTNLKILLKNNINILLGRMKKKNKKISTMTALVFLILGGLGILALYSYQAFVMMDGLGKNGLYDLCIFHGYLTGLSVAIILGIMRVTASENSNDNDFLLSLPIKKIEIIISKVLSKYIFDLFFSVVLILPYIVIYQILCKLDFLILLRGIISVLIIPLLSVGISYIFSFLISRVFNKTSISKLLKSLFSILITIIIMVLILTKTSFYGTIKAVDMNNYFSDRFFSNMFLNFVIYGKLWQTVVSISICVFTFVLGLVFYNLNYGKEFLGYKGNIKKLKFNSEKSAFFCLIKKELGTYFTTPAWIINSIIGPVFILVFSVLLCISGEKMMVQLIGSSIPSDLTVCVIALFFCAMAGMTTISGCTISLEGKNFWILKSNPIDEKKLLLAKSLLQMILLEPSIIVSTIVLAISLKLSVLGFAIIFVVPTIVSLILSFGGVFINLMFPLLDFDNETKVVKQSFATLLSMVFGLVVSLIMVGIYLLFKSELSIFFIFLIVCLTYAILLVGVICLLFTKGIKLFRNIE